MKTRKMKKTNKKGKKWLKTVKNDEKQCYTMKNDEKINKKEKEKTMAFSKD